VSMNELLAQSDYVVPLVPLNDNTRALFTSDTFKKMKKDSVLINCSRGAIVDQDALVAALKNGTIAACGLDVTSPEPLPLSSPLLAKGLQDKVVIFPHIGSATLATRTKMAQITASNLISGLYDEPLQFPVY